MQDYETRTSFETNYPFEGKWTSIVKIWISLLTLGVIFGFAYNHEWEPDTSAWYTGRVFTATVENFTAVKNERTGEIEWYGLSLDTGVFYYPLGRDFQESREMYKGIKVGSKYEFKHVMGSSDGTIIRVESR